jgi:phosphoenolpyruvate carboxykinase (GTP)
VFGVNWFRKDADGGWLWPGFGENLRVLLWALQRAEGKVDAIETPIGLLPKPGDLNMDGLDVSTAALDELLAVRKDEWRGEADEIGEFYTKFGDRLPESMADQLAGLRTRLG